MKDIKKEMIEKSAEDFQKLNEDSKMFILSYKKCKYKKALLLDQRKKIIG